MGDQKPVGFCIFYQHNCDRGVSFCNVMAKNPWLFAYLSITTATGVSVSAMRLPKTHGFLHISLYLAGCQNPDILPKPKICSKHENLPFAVITFGRLLATSKNQISCRKPKYAPNKKILPFAVTTFGRLLATSKNQISCQRPKYAPNMRICPLL